MQVEFGNVGEAVLFCSEGNFAWTIGRNLHHGEASLYDVQLSSRSSAQVKDEALGIGAAVGDANNDAAVVKRIANLEQCAEWKFQVSARHAVPMINFPIRHAATMQLVGVIRSVALIKFLRQGREGKEQEAKSKKLE